MIGSEYERRLKACNPKLRIKKYGTSMAAIHWGTRHICRIGQGEMLPYNGFTVETGFADQYQSDFNPKGEYRYKLLTKRGRAEAARILYTQGLITYSQIPQLSK